MDDQQLLRYSRHLMLEGFDVEGQEKLLSASVLVVGAGGLGCPAAMYLASAGVGTIILCDDDLVEVSNLQRQIGHSTNDIGKNKVDSLADTLRVLNPDVSINTIQQRMDEELLCRQIPNADVVLDCSDNFSTRFLLNRLCVKYHKPLVSGAAVRAEGQVAVFAPSSEEGGCYRCLYSDASDDETLTCSENGVLAPVVGVVGSMQALEAIKVLAGFGQPLVARLLAFDFRNAEWRQLSIPRDPQCPVCSG